jgi:hypothetical protein
MLPDIILHPTVQKSIDQTYIRMKQHREQTLLKIKQDKYELENPSIDISCNCCGKKIKPIDINYFIIEKDEYYVGYCIDCNQHTKKYRPIKTI